MAYFCVFFVNLTLSIKPLVVLSFQKLLLTNALLGHVASFRVHTQCKK